MDFKTPCQVLLGLLLAAAAVSILGLAADNISYANKHHFPSPVAIHYTRWNETAHQQYSYWVTMDYTPSRFSLGPMTAMIVTSLLCCFVGAGVALGSCMTRGTKALGTSFSFKKPSVSFLPISIIMTTITFLVSLAVAIFVWYPVNWSPVQFRSSLPLPPSSSKSHITGPAIFQASSDYTPEVWNCLLAPYAVQPAEKHKLQSLCHEAGVAKYMMVPVILLSAALLSSLLWSWRQARIAAAQEAENVNSKEVNIEQISVRGKE